MRRTIDRRDGHLPFRVVIDCLLSFTDADRACAASVDVDLDRIFVDGHFSVVIAVANSECRAECSNLGRPRNNRKGSSDVVSDLKKSLALKKADSAVAVGKVYSDC
ncbi:hypothetical protein O8B39_13055 [Agrobacterium rhizogenes]|nr:hypothetical protein [Rhizobium rhizogenes]